jgi:hypothetical protein
MRRTLEGQNIYEYSLNPDDLNTIPLYEQIYSIAGLAQYARITQDWEVLDDIRRTIRAFDAFLGSSVVGLLFASRLRHDAPR